MKGLIKNGAFYLIIAALILLYFLFPNSVSSSVENSLMLCKNVVIPSLFLFFILSNLFIESGMCEAIGRVLSHVLSPMFNLSGPACVAFILSLIAGYPAGGIGAVTLYKSGGVSKPECERLLMFSNNCGPGFIITALGVSMLGSREAGMFLYLIHIACAALLGVMTGRFFKAHRFASSASKKHIRESPLILFTGAIKKSTVIMLDVCAIIVTFSALIGLLSSSGVLGALSGMAEGIGIPGEISKGAVSAIFELTCGSSMICAGNADTVITMTLLSGFIGFGGICVHMQLLPYIHDAGLSAKKYLIGKVLHGAVSAGITYVIMRFMYRTGAVFAPGGTNGTPSGLLWQSVLLFLCAVGAMAVIGIIVLKKRR